MKIKDIMREPIIVTHKDTFSTVLNTLLCHKTNSALVVDDDGRLDGEINVLLLLKEVVPDYLEGNDIAAHFATLDIFHEDIEKAQDVHVEKMMNKKPKTITLDSSLMSATIVAMQAGQSRVPVVDEEGRPIGVLTRTQLKQLIGQHLNLDHCFTD